MFSTGLLSSKIPAKVLQDNCFLSISVRITVFSEIMQDNRHRQESCEINVKFGLGIRTSHAANRESFDLIFWVFPIIAPPPPHEIIAPPPPLWYIYHDWGGYRLSDH